MKKIFLLMLLAFSFSSKAQQVYPLKTYGIEFPKDSYVKDTNNELQSFEGIWKGNWNGKSILVILKKIKFYKSYLGNRAYYSDIIIGKFKVLDIDGNILFDNTNLLDDQAKIKGTNFKKIDNKYSLIYNDPDLCHITGNIAINFTDTTKTKLEWKYYQNSDWTDNDCFYYGLPQSQRPDPLPKNIVLTKQ